MVGCSLKGKQAVTKLGGTFFVKGTVVEHRVMDAVEVEGDKGFMHVVRPAGGTKSLNAWQPNLRLVIKPKSLPELPVSEDKSGTPPQTEGALPSIVSDDKDEVRYISDKTSGLVE
eukprot:2274412-Amphidinium_carterae.1